MWIIPTYVLAALAEIGGCFAFWAWLRLDRSPWWLIPGMASLALFAWALTRIEAGGQSSRPLGRHRRGDLHPRRHSHHFRTARVAVNLRQTKPAKPNCLPSQGGAEVLP